MATYDHLIIHPPRGTQYVVMNVNTFPVNSLVFGSSARINDEIVFDVKATRTGGGVGYVTVADDGVPSIRGPAGEYTFNWFCRSAVGVAKSATYTCVMNTAGFADVTAPTVGFTNATVNVVSPALSGTVNDNTAVVVITIAGKDYKATNNLDGTWSLAAGVIDALVAGANAVTVRAADAYGNISSVAGTVTYQGTAYTFLASFDVSAQTGWTNGQLVSSISSSVGAYALTSLTNRNPTYESATKSLVFDEVTQYKYMANTSMPSFAEIFMVISDTASASFKYLFEITDAANGAKLDVQVDGTNYRFSGSGMTATSIAGRVAGAVSLIHMRAIGSNQFTVSINGGAETTFTGTSVPAAFGRLYIHDANIDPCNMKLYQAAVTAALSSGQRSALISDLKTKWGIA